MIILVVLAILLVAFWAANQRTRKTNTYKNFYRAIHVVKDVTSEEKYHIGAFGSTFSYYAYDLKPYSGHNFSIEPQSIAYMGKTIEHFIDNIDAGGFVLISLAGCFFAATSTASDEECTTYYSFLRPVEFDRYDWKVKLKYLLKRYFPALLPFYLKSNWKDEPMKYAVNEGISYDTGLVQAKRRLHGWEKVVAQPITEQFRASEDLERKMRSNVERMKRIVAAVRSKDITPVFVVLPMSKAFNDVCPAAFYDQVLYRCLDLLKEEKVQTLDFLYDDELSEMKYYLMADCLNAKGRELFTQKVMEAITDRQEHTVIV